MSNPYLKHHIIEIVENQLNENNPPITIETYNRLIKAGYTSEIAKEKIATIVVDEIFDVLKHNSEYNEDRFTNRLNTLE